MDYCDQTGCKISDYHTKGKLSIGKLSDKNAGTTRWDERKKGKQRKNMKALCIRKFNKRF